MLLALVGVLAACGDTPTEHGRSRLGSADLTLVDSTEVHPIADMEAAFWVYNPGPGPGERSMYLVLASRQRRPRGTELEFYQFLPPLHETPLEGTFPVMTAALGGTPMMSGSLLVLSDTTVRQFMPFGGDDSLSVRLVTPDSLTGRLDLTLGGAYGERVAIRGTFTAVRVALFEDLPRAR